jgi:oxalate decarboxylase
LNERLERGYEEIEMSEWLAANPADVLATNFDKPAALFKKFPHKDVFITNKRGLLE